MTYPNPELGTNDLEATIRKMAQALGSDCNQMADTERANMRDQAFGIMRKAEQLYAWACNYDTRTGG